ncbi:MAG: LysR family transcriptional regulator substrate-binding protein [Ruminococcus sp.]|nr:LysR family transcriptional regulator substrate-binding protein [Ruminococcus sp.]
MPIISSVIIAPVLHRFRKNYPFVKVELIEGTALEIRNAVTEHRVDFGITSSPFENFDVELLMQDRMLAISNSPFKADTYNLHSSPEELIFCRAGHETAMEILKKQDISLEKSFIVQQAETVIKLVENENGIGVISGLVLSNNANSLYTIPVNPDIEIDIGIVSTNLDDLTPSAIEMKRMIKEQVQSLQNME